MRSLLLRFVAMPWWDRRWVLRRLGKEERQRFLAEVQRENETLPSLAGLDFEDILGVLDDQDEARDSDPSPVAPLRTIAEEGPQSRAVLLAAGVISRAQAMAGLDGDAATACLAMSTDMAARMPASRPALAAHAETWLRTAESREVVE